MTKREFFSALLAAVMVSGMSGCAKEEVSAPENSDVSQDITESTTEYSSEVSTEQSDVHSDFDFDEAVKNITLFGQRISLPCTITDLGKDFSFINLNYITSVPGENSICVDLAYQGKEIGSVFLADCNSNDILDDKEIFILSLGFTADYGYSNSEQRKEYLKAMNKYSEIISLDLGGLSFETTVDELLGTLGDSIVDDKHNYAGITLRDISYSPFSDRDARIKFSYANGIAYEIYIQV